MTSNQHELILPLTYVDKPWNHDFYVVCSCGWVDARISHDADTRGHSFPDLHQRAANVVANHALEVTLLRMLTDDHIDLHVIHSQRGKHPTFEHLPIRVNTYLSAKGVFHITCNCGRLVTTFNRKYLSPNGQLSGYTTRNLATNLRRQFYGHCYEPATTLVKETI